MKTEYYTTKWLRRLEMASLINFFLIIPLLFFVMAIQISFFLPPEYVNYTAGITLALVAIFLFFIFGKISVIPLKHYVQHQEKRDDVIKARLFFAFIFGDITIIFFSLMIYSRI